MPWFRFRYLAFLAVLVAGCTDATWHNVTSLGSPHVVRLWSGGQCVREWKSTGKVLTEERSDGWIFVDAETGKLVRVSGDVSVEQQ